MNKSEEELKKIKEEKSIIAIKALMVGGIVTSCWVVFSYLNYWLWGMPFEKGSALGGHFGFTGLTSLLVFIWVSNYMADSQREEKKEEDES